MLLSLYKKLLQSDTHINWIQFYVSMYNDLLNEIQTLTYGITDSGNCLQDMKRRHRTILIFCN
jgi:hypothetical protein